jgi:prophage regulatory protein
MDTIRSSRLLRLRDVSELTSLGKSTINLWVANGKFPAPTALSATIKVWRQSDIDGWMAKVFPNQAFQSPDAESPTENVRLLHD